MIADMHLADHAGSGAWWEYTFPNGHDATVWLDHATAALRFDMESSDGVAGHLAPEATGLHVAKNLTTDQVEDRLTLLAALPQKENQ